MLLFNAYLFLFVFFLQILWPQCLYLYICFVVEFPVFHWRVPVANKRLLFLSFCCVFPSFYCGSSKHGVTKKHIIESVCVCFFVWVCFCGHQLCCFMSEIQVTSCLPKCRFLSAPITHTHRQTHTLTCLALGCIEHISCNIPSTTGVQQNHWPQHTHKYDCTHASIHIPPNTFLLVRLWTCGLCLTAFTVRTEVSQGLFCFVCECVCLRTWEPNQQIASSCLVVFCLFMQQIQFQAVSKP